MNPLARDRQQSQARIGLDLGQQGERLAADEDQRGDIARAQRRERLRLGQCGRLNVDRQLVEDDAGGHEGAAALGAEVDPLAAQVVDRGELVARQQMDLLVVELGDVGDLLLDPGVQVGALVEVEDVRLHDRDVDAAQQQQILDVAHRALADHRQHPGGRSPHRRRPRDPRRCGRRCRSRRPR